MELFLGLVALGLIGWFVWPKAKKAADVNEDGKVDVEDAKAVVAKVEDAVVAEAKEAATELVKEVDKVIEEVAAKVEEEVKEEVKEVVAKAKKATSVRNTKKKK
jgi:hypothetical protein